MGKRKKINRICLQVCSACHYNCDSCVTYMARKTIPDYQLSIRQLETLLETLEESNYFVKTLHINGLGEPLLWENLNDGILMLRNSKSIGDIDIRTNGLAFDRLSQEAIRAATRIAFSIYEENESIANTALKTYGRRKIHKHTRDKFMNISGDVAPIPCNCSCPGPTVIGDYILPYCGSVIFSAESVKRFESAFGNSTCFWPDFIQHILGQKGMMPIESHCLNLAFIETLSVEKNSKQFVRNLDACKYCWGNSNFERTIIPHIQKTSAKL